MLRQQSSQVNIKMKNDAVFLPIGLFASLISTLHMRLMRALSCGIFFLGFGT